MSAPSTACATCAPQVAGKPWALLVQGPGSVHECRGSDGRVVRATSRAWSWHATREAAMAARARYRREVRPGARAWTARAVPPPRPRPAKVSA